MLAAHSHIAHSAANCSLRQTEACSTSPRCELLAPQCRRWVLAHQGGGHIVEKAAACNRNVLSECRRRRVAASAAPEPWGAAAGATGHTRRPTRGTRCSALSTGVSRSPHPSSPQGSASSSESGAGPPAAGSSPQSGKVGVLLLNLGGPEKLEDVQPFLYNLFADPDIIRLPPGVRFLQPLLATIIAGLRAPKSSEGYEAIGGGSPLRKITDDQAAAIQEALRRKGVKDAEVRGLVLTSRKRS